MKREVTGAEEFVCEKLSEAFANTAVGEEVRGNELLASMSSGLGMLIPEVISEVDESWEGETPDTVLIASARIFALREIRIAGVFDMLPDADWEFPFQVSIQLARNENLISWMECRVGEKGPWQGMKPPAHPRMRFRLTARNVMKRIQNNSISWYYEVGFGERE